MPRCALPEDMLPCWRCGFCTHAWLKVSADAPPPDQCARCRKRNWNFTPEVPSQTPVTAVTKAIETNSAIDEFWNQEAAQK